MSIIDIIFIGIALSIDACAVTIANCATYKNCLSKKKELAMPVLFAFFQGLMPLIGYGIGSLFEDLLAPITKFVTAGIFFFLAIKIVVDIFKREEENTCPVNSLAISMIVVQAVATSIDALAVGITLIEFSQSVFIAIGLISGVTFALVSLALV